MPLEMKNFGTVRKECPKEQAEEATDHRIPPVRHFLKTFLSCRNQKEKIFRQLSEGKASQIPLSEEKLLKPRFRKEKAFNHRYRMKELSDPAGGWKSFSNTGSGKKMSWKQRNRRSRKNVVYERPVLGPNFFLPRQRRAVSSAQL